MCKYTGYHSYNLRATRTYRDRKHHGGFCVYGGCWELAATGRVYCSKHRVMDTEQQRRRRARNRELVGGRHG